MKRYSKGFCFIELVIFMVIVSLLSAGIFTGLTLVLHRSEQDLIMQQLHNLAQERMELILAQRNLQTFPGINASNYDPCQGESGSKQAVCTTFPKSFTVSSKFFNQWHGDKSYKVITVTVNTTSGHSFNLDRLMANYEIQNKIRL